MAQLVGGPTVHQSDLAAGKPTFRKETGCSEFESMSSKSMFDNS